MGGQGGGPDGNSGGDNVDIAALLAGGLAATISLTVGEGPWTLISLPIGVVLVTVVWNFAGALKNAGAGGRLAAWAGVVALCGAVAVAPPLQFLFDHVDTLQDRAMWWSGLWKDDCKSPESGCVAIATSDALVVFWGLGAIVLYATHRARC